MSTPASPPVTTRAAILPVAAALFTVLLWASAFVAIRDAGEELSPGPLTLGRLLVGTVALGTVALIRRESLPPRRALRDLVLCGLLWFGAYNVLLNAAERRVDAGTASMLVNVGPILIAVLAGLFLGEGFPRPLVLGCIVSFSGAIVIGLATADGFSIGAGALLCFAAALAYACGVIFQKRVLTQGVTALQATVSSCVIGTLACLPFAPGLVDELGDASGGAIGWTVYLGVFPTAIAFTTWAYALARTTAGRLGATTYLVPPITIAMSWALLDETPPLAAVAGGVLCLAGVVVARRKPRGSG